jgi:hypothetical protein
MNFDKLKHLGMSEASWIDHKIPGFSRTWELAPFQSLSLCDWTMEEWHNYFTERVFNARSKNLYLPIFRVSHGEFIMAVGRRVDQGANIATRLKQSISIVRQSILSRFCLAPAFFSGSLDNSFETFSSYEVQEAKRIYTHSMREISNRGILAIAFNNTIGFGAYINPFCRWLNAVDISLSIDNYCSFYSVYALIFGDKGRELLHDQNVLVITSLNSEKESAIKRSLLEYGARAVQFIGVSPSKAMFDRINLNSISLPVNVVLVGAGVGSSAILRQVEPLSAVSIDAGFALDAIAYPDKRWNRPYCVRDDELERSKIRFL